MRFIVVLLFVCLCSIVFTDARAEDAYVSICERAESRIDFKVNLTALDPAYHSNDLNLKNVLARIDSMLLNPAMKVERIAVVGTASPDGPYENNGRLAAERARAFINILQERYSFPDSIYDIETIAEDWDGMREMLAGNSNIPYAGVVLEFLDESRDDDRDLRELRLKRLDGGRPYASMRENVLPYLRRASVIVRYDRISQDTSMAEPDNGEENMPPVMDSCVAGVEALPVIPPPSRRRFFALKTNLLWDAALCANLGFEVELWPRWSLDVPVWYSPYDITDRWRIRLLATQPELRYWLKDAGAGHYFGAHASVVGFNVSTGGDYRYQDPNHAAFGFGLGYGYSFHLDKEKRWSIEGQIGAGYISYRWVKYHNTGRNGAAVSRGSGTYWGVTRAGIAISFKFYKERKGRRWMKW